MGLRTKRQLQAGFTFVELVIAIAILGVLALIVVPRVARYFDEAAVETTRTNLKTVKMEIDNYIRKHHGQPPQSLKDLVRRPANMTQQEWGGPFLDGDEEPLDGFNTPLVYKSMPGNQPPYSLRSWGKDGVGSPAEGWIYPK